MMKISIAFTDDLRGLAGIILDALRIIIPMRTKVKETELRDGFRHIYIATRSESVKANYLTNRGDADII